MSIKSALLKNTFWNLTAYSYLLITSLISLPFIIAGLGQPTYAVYVVILAISAILSTLDFGIPVALVRSLSSKSNFSDKLGALRCGVTVTLFLGSGVTLLSRYLFFSSGQLPVWGFAPELLEQLLGPFTALVFGTQLLSYFTAVAQGQSDFAVYNVRSYLVGTGNTLLTAIVALSTHNLVYVLWTQVACTALTLLLFILYTVSLYGTKAILPSYSPPVIRAQLAFGLPVFIGNFAPQLQANLSRFVTGAYLPSLGITAVAVAQSLVVRGTGVFNQFTSVFFPAAAKLSSPGDRLRLRRLTLQLTLLFLLLAATAFLTIYWFGMPILSWWLQDESLASSVYPVLLGYLLYAVVIALTPAVATALTATGHPQAPAITSWLHAILELGLLLFLLPVYGAVGAPYAALGAVCVSTLLLLWYYHRYLPGRSRVKIG